ncbi:MAG: hypothetical protein OCD76_08725 [Reichenbachiella sp.]
MKKLKPFFYGIYIAFFIFAAFLGIFYEDLVLNWKWDWIDTWVGLMAFVLKMAGIGTILFGAALIIDGIHIRSLKKELKEKDDIIEQLKNKS